MSDHTILNVGKRVRTIRDQRGLSLRGLAQICDLSINTISLIERGENSPTVTSLHQLATALEVPITSFFEEEHKQLVVFVQPGQRLRSQSNGILLESLATGLRNQQVEPFLMQIEPGAGNIDDPVTHAGDEFVHCLQGEIEYCVGDQMYILSEGCSLLFKASQPHCFRNAAGEQVLLMVIFMAGEGTHHLAHQHHLTD